MVNRHIDDEVKRLALRLWHLGWSREDIINIFCVSQSSLYRWVKLFAEEGVVSRKSFLRGRPRTIMIAACSAIRELYERHPDTYLDELQWFLAVQYDISISLSSLGNHLRQAGLTRKVLHKIAIERDEALRAEFQQVLQTEFSGTGREFVTIDESSKNEHEIARRYGRSPAGERASVNEPFIRGVRYSLVAAMSTDGYIAQRVIEGSFNSESFYHFIVEDVLPQMDMWPGDRSVLVMDNCRIHHNELIRQAASDAGVLLLYLPPYSPDLNPIERSFSVWKAHLRRNYEMVRAVPDPYTVLIEACGVITAEMAEGWFRLAGYTTNSALD